MTPTLNECVAVGLALALAGCATTTPTPPASPAKAPIVSTVAHAGPLIPVPASPPAVLPQNDGMTLDARLRQIDDQYARRLNETRQLVQQTLAGMKAAPSATDVAALKASIGRLETQVTQLLAAKGRMESTVGGVTGRLQGLERQLAEQAAVKAAAVPVPQAKAEDPDDSGFATALKELDGPAMGAEPMRRWLELHPTHARVPEGLYQLGLAYDNRGYPTAATYYWKRLIADYPMSLQAKEAQGLLAALEPVPPPKKATSKKSAAPARAAKPGMKSAKEVTAPVPTADAQRGVMLPARTAPTVPPAPAPTEGDMRVVPQLPGAPKPSPIPTQSLQSTGESLAK